MAVRIHIPSALRAHTGGLAAVEVSAASVGEALSALIAAHPTLLEHLRDRLGRLRAPVRITPGGPAIRSPEDEATPLPEGAALALDAPGELPPLSRAERSRYARHLILPEVGIDGQRRLKASSAICVGTGGLGSPLLLYLAAAGVGRIGIVDFDAVETSNLQRQIIHGSSQVGRPKVESARDRIREINPEVEVDCFNEALSSTNALRILGGYDVVVDGSDNFPTRYLVNDACVILDKPYVYGSIFKFEGQCSVFNYRGGPTYRDLYPQPPPPGLVPSCAEGGVLGVLPGVIGCLQATEALKILLGAGETLSGRLLLYDALRMRFRELKLRRDPEAEPITELVDYRQLCGAPQPPGTERGLTASSAAQVAARLREGWAPYVLDVREPHEAAIASLDFTDRLHPHRDIAAIAGELPRDRDILLVCRSGERSALAARTLAGLGLSRLVNLEGGLLAWAAAVDPDLEIV